MLSKKVWPRRVLKKLLKCCYRTGSSSPWYWKKYADGTFEAWRVSNAGSTGTLTQLGSSGIYYSTPVEIPFPSIGITAIRSIEFALMPTQNFLMSAFMNRLSASSVYIGFIRFGAGASVSNIEWRLHITGTWS